MPLVMTIIGFLMLTVGVAMLMVGEVPFLASRRISAVRSRLIGAVFVGFLPLALLVRIACNMFLEPDAVEGPVLTAFVFSFCCLLTLAILFRVLFPKREPREPRKPAKTISEPVKPNPFANEAPAAMPDPTPTPTWLDTDASPSPSSKKPAKKAPAQKAKKPAAEQNPFDLS